MATIVEVNDLRAYYVTEAYGVRRTVQAVDGISLSIQEGEVFGIAGESGCGKSTLLKVLLGAHRPPLVVRSGTVTYRFDDTEIGALSVGVNTLRDLRWKQVSYIPQGSMHVLNPVRRIRDTFHDFIVAHTELSGVQTLRFDATLSRANSACPRKSWLPILTSFPAACGSV